MALRVLLVEDNALAAEATMAALRTVGHIVAGVTSAEAALALWEPGGCDVVITDVALPGMSGWDLLERLHRQCETTADPELLKLYQELKAFPIPARSAPLSSDNVAIPFKMRLDGEVLSFISTTMIFGTPVDITLSELAIETFFPADELTAGRMRNMAAGLK